MLHFVLHRLEKGGESSKRFCFETHSWFWKRIALGSGCNRVPAGNAEGSVGGSGDAGYAGENGGCIAAAGGTEQRIHGDNQVAAVGDDAAASEWSSDQDPGP